MKIITLIENTAGKAGCGTEHGLSVYIETKHHKLLMDTGASELLLQNAEEKGVDLTKVDTLILSHGHYDHGGGIPAFATQNTTAKIFLQESAFGNYYAVRKKERYIGLADTIRNLPQLVRLDGDYQIDEELALFAGIPAAVPIPSTNNELKIKTDAGYVPDDFVHEQCLLIREGDIFVLLSGCAHHGILNILEHFRTLYGRVPDYVISGFHLMRKTGYTNADMDEVREIAEELKQYPTIFYTGHCTGEEPYEIMKKIMGEQLHYLHCGDEIEIGISI